MGRRRKGCFRKRVTRKWQRGLTVGPTRPCRCHSLKKTDHRRTLLYVVGMIIVTVLTIVDPPIGTRRYEKPLRSRSPSSVGRDLDDVNRRGAVVNLEPPSMPGMKAVLD